jgi:hypothetical protein
LEPSARRARPHQSLVRDPGVLVRLTVVPGSFACSMPTSPRTNAGLFFRGGPGWGPRPGPRRTPRPWRRPKVRVPGYTHDRHCGEAGARQRIDRTRSSTSWRRGRKCASPAPRTPQGQSQDFPVSIAAGTAADVVGARNIRASGGSGRLLTLCAWYEASEMSIPEGEGRKPPRFSGGWVTRPCPG